MKEQKKVMGGIKGRRKRKRKSRELGQTTKPAPGSEIGEDISHPFASVSVYH